MSNLPSKPSGQGSSLDEGQRLAYLRAMGIHAWSLKNSSAISDDAIVLQQQAATAATASAVIATESTPTIVKADIATLDWKALQQQVSQCQQCELHATRSQTVFGMGSQSAQLLIIGAAPAADDDRTGQPFAGRAGELLNAMLRAIQLNREQVYIANVLKCMPPQNRKPHTSEMICCDAYLQRQISLLQPKLILALGEIAARHLIFAQGTLDNLRGRLHKFNGIPVIASYTPEALLNSPADKGKAWQDLLQVKQLLNS